MFLQGFVFALGFGAGSIFLGLILSVTLMAMDSISSRSRKTKESNRPIDIEQWQERKPARSDDAYENPRSAS